MNNISGYSANIPIVPTVSVNVTVSNSVFKPVSTFFLESKNKIDDSIKPQFIYEDMFISLEQPLETILKTVDSLIIKKRSTIILIHEPPNSSYETYETALMYILNEISKKFKNIYLYNENYLKNLVNSASKYKGLIRGLYIKTYGLCADTSRKDLVHLYSYEIDIKTLQANTAILKRNDIGLVVQTNSICEQNPKVSNTFGSQLWLLDFLFQVSMGGAESVVIESTNTNNIYAYSIFNQVTDGAQLYQCKIRPDILGVTAYLNKNNEEGQTVVVINTSQKDVQISISLDTQYSGKVYMFNTNQLEDSEFGISYGEITYDSGRPVQIKTKNSNTRLSEKAIVKASDHTYTFSVAKKSAAVMKAPFNSLSGGAMFAQINNEDEDKTLVTVRPYQLTDEYDAVPTQMTVTEFKKKLSDM
jgi:hypothetical protein